MKNYSRKKVDGFTLIEMLLVGVIIAMLVYASMSYFQNRALQSRIDRTAAQMQQILNAGMAFYVQNGMWPTSLGCLQGDGSASTCNVQYLPTNLASPWGGNQYTAMHDTTGQNFLVYVKLDFATASAAPAEVGGTIAGSLPLSYVSGDTSSSPPDQATPCATSATECSIVSSVTIPGQNLNNARAVNFAGLYRNGGCVPVPTCPVDPTSGNPMVPQIFVVPVSVSGFNDSAASNNNVYPISSFTAYATPSTPPLNTSPPLCTPNVSPTPTITSTDCNATLSPGGTPASAYWRACLQVVTERGPLNSNTANSMSNWGGNVSLMAITRCAVANEPAGSRFTVFN